MMTVPSHAQEFRLRSLNKSTKALLTNLHSVQRNSALKNVLRGLLETDRNASPSDVVDTVGLMSSAMALQYSLDQMIRLIHLSKKDRQSESLSMGYLSK